MKRSSSIKKLALSIAAIPQITFNTAAIRIMIPAKATQPSPCVESFTAVSFRPPRSPHAPPARQGCTPAEGPDNNRTPPGKKPNPHRQVDALVVCPPH
jgi:hypothetical protein